MRQVVRSAILFACAVLVMQAQFSARASAASQVQFSQTIRPLLCTVDIVAVGAVTDVVLSPAECVHSPDARQLLETTRFRFEM